MFKRSVLVLLSSFILIPAWLASAAPEGLILYWPFDEGQGTVATDRSGNGNDGALEGGAFWAPGTLGTAACKGPAYPLQQPELHTRHVGESVVVAG